jgi:pilus assembly protein CpaE
MVTSVLRERGYEVEAVNDGLAGLKAVQQFQPHLVLTDINMPNVNGFELTRQLRSSHRWARIPIVMFSTRSAAEDVLASSNVGADAYVTKPLNMPDLLSHVEALLARPAAGAPAAGPAGRVVTFLRGKGGVGLTSTIARLASALPVGEAGLLDLNLEFGDLAMTVGLNPETTLLDVARASTLPEDERAGQDFVVRHPDGYQVIAAPPAPQWAELVTVPAVQLALDTLVGRASVVLVDTPTTLGESTLLAVDRADRLCVVTGPSLMAVYATRRLLDVLDQIGINRERVLVVLNRVTPAGLNNDEAEARLGRPIDAVLPYSLTAAEMSARGAVAALPHVDESLAAALQEFAARLTDGVSVGAVRTPPLAL